MELKRLREKLRLSQTEVANRLGINSQTYNRYETGVNQPNIEMLIKLANFFNVSIDDLVGRESDTINLNFYNENKKSLLGYLAKEDDKTIERVFDFYKGLKYDMLNQSMGLDKFKIMDMFNQSNNLNFPTYENQITKSMEQTEFLRNIADDPFFKDKLKDENK